MSSRVSILFLLHAGVLALVGCTPAKQPTPEAPCLGKSFKSATNGKLSSKDRQDLAEAVAGGKQFSVGFNLLAGDKDSKGSVTWFEPVSTTVLDGVVYAESAPLKWPPSRFTWTNGDTAVGAISFRLSSDGELSSVQNNESAKTEQVSTLWCVS